MKKLYPEEAVQDIADAIRAKNGLSTSYRIGDMASAIREIPTGGGSDDNFLIAMGASVGSIYNSTVTSIMSSQFQAHYNITGVEMTAVNIINYEAFMNCDELSYASFPNCETISEMAFDSCNTLSSLTLPNVSFISASAFQGCSALSILSLPKCKTILSGAFNRCGLKEVYIPECVTLSNTNQTGRGVFGSTSLPSIDLPKVEYIGSQVFISCSYLSLINASKCTYIGYSAFKSCYMLERINLLSPSVCSLVSINAFMETPMSVSSYLGYYGSIYVPSSLVDAYKSSTNWSAYSDRITAYVE